MRCLSGWMVALAFAPALFAGCGGGAAPTPPTPGTLTLAWTPTPPSLLAETTGTLYFEELYAVGDSGFDRRLERRDVLVPLEAPTELVLTDLPQGLYSRFRGEIEGLTLDATYQGTPVQIRAAFEAVWIDLRGDGVEVALGHSGRFLLAFDIGAWFDATVLDSAERTGDVLLFDPTHNRELLLDVLNRIGASFSLTTLATDG